ncbi:hypothetical protein psal_cds_915 [Pandoravirus salinus]|uniref:Uncharacterized protein n=1 Tax=Pandoravirus salinus TaxID=1349410 RepID=S4W403_9VIRU|nr:hypothetical protein psal_cds_915 [Pandoravirus salinus]AGO85030.1 hypothetical protein psal_cds_915 [Pandoravirus salinus]
MDSSGSGHPLSKGTTTGDTAARRDHGSAASRAAIDLVARAYLEYKCAWIASRLECRTVGDTKEITLNRYTVHTGDSTAVDRMRAELPLRLATTIDVDDPMLVECVHLSRRAGCIKDFWHEPGKRAVHWLGRSLCANDDAAHCALEIGALVGNRRWRAYADTSSNVRRGTALPWTPCIVAGARNRRRDLFLQDYDTLAAREMLDRVSQTGGRDDATGARGRRHRPVVRHGGMCAVEVAPGQWDLSRGPSAKSTGMPPVDTECMAHMLTSARLATHHNATISLYVGGHPCAGMGSAGKHVSLALAKTSLDRDDARTRGVVTAAALIDDPHQADFVEMASAVRNALAVAQDSLQMIAPDAAWLVGLREALHSEDSSRLRLSVGDVWDAAAPSSAIECGDVTFVADARSVWRNAFGATVSWDDLVQTVRPRRLPGLPSITLVPSGRVIDMRFTRDDPCVAPDFAYRLCCNALTGDLGAIDWMGVLALASPQWAMLDTTVCRVLSWMRDGAPVPAPPSTNYGAHWREPLVDWILDLVPADDPAARFAAAQDAFNREVLRGIVEAGQHAIYHCVCVRADNNNKGDADATSKQCDGMCLWRECDYISAYYRGSNTGPTHSKTYRRAVTDLLTRVPLSIDGRHILAADAFCPLLGDQGRGVEALVRALYTCAPLRKKIIEPAQLALAERVLAPIGSMQ